MLEKEKPRIFRVLSNEGKVVHTEPHDFPTALWKWFAESFGLKEESNADFVDIPEEQVRWKPKLVQRCLFDAVDAFLKHWHGMLLDLHDEAFFANHSLVDSNGTPQAWTLRVAQELIQPYGFRVSRVRMPRGVSLFGDLGQWTDVLGVNPLAVLSRQVSNAEFAQQVGLPLAEVREKYRFDFSDAPLRPCIGCGIVEMSLDAEVLARYGLKKSDVLGFGGGHAQYYGPRGPWRPSYLEFQIDVAERVPWRKEPVFDEIAASDSKRELDLYLIKGKNNKTYNESRGGDLVVSYGLLPYPTETRFRGGYQKSGKTPCGVCEKPTKQKRLVAAKICTQCWAEFWAQYRCYHCAQEFGKSMPPLAEVNRKQVGCKCPKCGTLCFVNANESSLAAAIITGILGSHEVQSVERPVPQSPAAPPSPQPLWDNKRLDERLLPPRIH